MAVSHLHHSGRRHSFVPHGGSQPPKAEGIHPAHPASRGTPSGFTAQGRSPEQALGPDVLDVRGELARVVVADDRAVKERQDAVMEDVEEVLQDPLVARILRDLDLAQPAAPFVGTAQLLPGTDDTPRGYRRTQRG